MRRTRCPRLRGQLWPWREPNFARPKQRDNALVLASGQKIERDASVLSGAEKSCSVRASRTPINPTQDDEQTLKVLLVGRRHRLPARPEM